MTVSCSTLENRPRPSEILDCNTLKEKIVGRNQFFRGIRGRASVKSAHHTLNINAVLAYKDKARFEVKGPFNIVLALMSVDEQWIQLFVPREKTVYRFPYSEFYNDNYRRDQFLRLLPIAIETEVFFEALMSLVHVNSEASKGDACFYDTDENAYVVQNYQGKAQRLYLVDPTTFRPLSLNYFRNKEFPVRDYGRHLDRADYKVRYEKSMGEGLASFPSVTIMNNGRHDVLKVTWKEAEAWVSPDEDIFSWEPPRSIKIEHY